MLELLSLTVTLWLVFVAAKLVKELLISALSANKDTLQIMENADPVNQDAKFAMMKQLALSALTTCTCPEATVNDAKETARLVIAEMSALVLLVREALL